MSYIDKQATIDAIYEKANEELADANHHFLAGVHMATAVVMGMPDAQPERKRGRWNITDAYPHNVYCSECYTRFAQTHWAVWEDGSLPRNFCPNCGADMREVDDERPD